MTIPEHQAVVTAHERYDYRRGMYYTAYRAVCSCNWRGFMYREHPNGVTKDARKKAESDALGHYEIVRCGGKDDDT